jgi:uncharacterized protein (TIGR03086 family)
MRGSQSMQDEQLNRALANTRAVMAKVSTSQLDAPTPCRSWDVRALINHVIGSARWATAAISGGEAGADEDYAAGDFVASYDESIAAALTAFGEHGAMDKTIQLPFGDYSGAGLMVVACTDQFTHGWDLARAIGHHTDLDPGLAEDLLVHARAGIPDAFRGPDGVAPFGPEVKAPAGAGAADRLAAFLGRSV